MLPASLLNCVHSPGLSAALGSKGPRGEGRPQQGEERRVRGCQGPPRTSCRKSLLSWGPREASARGRGTGGAPKISPSPVFRDPPVTLSSAPRPSWGSHLPRTVELFPSNLDDSAPSTEPAERALEKWGLQGHNSGVDWLSPSESLGTGHKPSPGALRWELRS